MLLDDGILSRSCPKSGHYMGRFRPTSRDTNNSGEKCMSSGGRTKEAIKRSFVFAHQHGGDDVA